MAYQFSAMMYFTGVDFNKHQPIYSGERPVTITVEDDRVQIEEVLGPGFEPRVISITQRQWEALPKKRMIIGRKDDTGMLRYTSNAKGKKMTADYEKMSGPELVNAYNSMAASPEGKALDIKQITRFSDLETALKRVTALATKLKVGSPAGEEKETVSLSDETGEKAVAEKPSDGQAAAADEETDMSTASIIERFGAREGTNREKVLKALAGRFGKPVAADTLLKSAYGSPNEKNKGALSMVLKGVDVMIKSKKLPFKLEREKAGEGMTYALKRK